jgi:hypothetical protein
MADFPVQSRSAVRRRSRPFNAAPDIRLRQLTSGAWEVGGTMSGKQIKEERIRDAAYFLWFDAGMPAGRDMEFWLAAENWDAEQGEPKDAKTEL